MTDFLVDTGRKLNVHKTFRRRPGQFSSSVYGIAKFVFEKIPQFLEMLSNFFVLFTSNMAEAY